MPSGARPQSVTVIGAGSWGTALALILADNIKRVRLWGRDAAQMAEMNSQRVNRRYLPDAVFPDNLIVEPNFDALADDTAFVLAIPCHAFADRLRALHKTVTAAGRDVGDVTVIWGSKGFAVGGDGDGDGGDAGGELLSDVVARVFPGAPHAVISGPSFAFETAARLPTALSLAGTTRADAAQLADWFRTPTTRVYFSDDLVGVQLGGAIKNVLAIAAGISDGLGFGANARAALITRGLAELTRLGVARGGRADTFTGLAGVGDLILTCTDNQSRNRRFGIGIGEGKSPDVIRREIGQEIEGIDAARELYAMSCNLQVEMPITEQVYRVLYDARDPKVAVRELLQRDPRAEDC